MSIDQYHFDGFPNPSPVPKVFMINQYEYCAGYDLESLKEWYLETTGLSKDEAFNQPQEVDLDRETIQLDSGETRTFREHLSELISQGISLPCHFAVTADAA